jgi:DNA-binding XRE family transcriptional regulator
VKLEVRATGLKAMCEKRGLTQRKLAHDLGISRTTNRPIESGARKPRPKLQQAMVKYFKGRFDELFEVVLINPESGQEQVLETPK